MNLPTQEARRTAYDENPALLRAYRAGDAEAGERLVLLNRPLVCHIAARFSGRGVEMEDLIACGNMGLVKAINSFDFSRECAFSTYAVPLIFGEIRRFLRDDGMVKVSREEKRLAARLSAEQERRRMLGEDTGIRAVALSLGVTPEDAASALSSLTPVRSLDECAYAEEDGVTLGSTLYDADAGERDFDRLTLALALERLPPQQRRLILLRYFRDLSQSETARLLGVTQVKVSREEKKILALLREQLR